MPLDSLPNAGPAMLPPGGRTILAPTIAPPTIRHSGILALDALLCGGFEPGSVWNIEGAPGVGKTLVGLHFLAQGLAEGEAGLYITAAEPPAKIVQFFAKYWPNLEAGIVQRQLAVLDPSPFFTELRLAKAHRTQSRIEPWDEVWRFVQDAIKQSRDMGARRIVIDPLTPLLLAYGSPIDLWDTIQTLVAAFGENRNATTLLTHMALDEPHFAAIGATLRALCTGSLRLEQRFNERSKSHLVIQAVKRRHAALGGHETSVYIGTGGHISHLEPITRPLGEQSA